MAPLPLAASHPGKYLMWNIAEGGSENHHHFILYITQFLLSESIAILRTNTVILKKHSIYSGYPIMLD